MIDYYTKFPRVKRDLLQLVSLSDETSIIKQKEEWAPLHGGRVDERSLSELALGPELKPVEVVRSELDVVIHAAMLEEQLLVTPEGADGVGAGHDPADQLLITTLLRRGVEGEDLEHDSVHGDDLDLILEVVLVLVGPAIDIVRLHVELIRPVRLVDLLAVLIELGNLHDRGSADVVSHGGQVLHDSLSGTLVVGFSQDSGPSVLEEVEGLVSIKRKHGNPVS